MQFSDGIWVFLLLLLSGKCVSSGSSPHRRFNRPMERRDFELPGVSTEMESTFTYRRVKTSGVTVPTEHIAVGQGRFAGAVPELARDFMVNSIFSLKCFIKIALTLVIHDHCHHCYRWHSSDTDSYQRAYCTEGPHSLGRTGYRVRQQLK